MEKSGFKNEKIDYPKKNSDICGKSNEIYENLLNMAQNI